MKILVVDDEERFGALVADHLRDAGHEVTALATGDDARRRLAESGFDLVITDLKMSPVDGLAVLDAARSAGADTDVVLMTAHGTLETAVAALRHGAYDYLTKPFSLDELSLLVERIAEQRSLRNENTALRQELAATGRFAEMVGSGPALGRVRELVAKVAGSDTTVLVLGESGTGKELVARLIHRSSPRAARPFVVVHAAALPETLLESELFGYERGAFTGATSRKPGRLELAAGGTLLLDEIGEIPASFQVKLLRFLQERTFVRLGGTQTITVDTRIVAATNRDLAAEARQARFREDLYYRLSVFPITVPPLRERLADLPDLCRHVLARLNCTVEPAPEVLKRLSGHDWPGNIRELENVLERALILAAGAPIGPQHIQLPEPVLTREAPTPGTPLAAMERQMVEDALRRSGNNKSKTAKLLGITRRMLYTKLRNLGIEFDDDDAEATA
jgi:DNA-binding NtrC family response regulator